MAKNISRVKKSNSSAKTESTKFSLFAWFERIFTANNALGGELPIRYVYYALWLGTLLIAYISIAHYAEGTLRDTDRLRKAVEDRRADYVILKASLMKDGKQSEISKKLTTAQTGISENKTPPRKIVVED
jgi:Bacteriodetes cell division protein (FtsL-like)